MPETAVLTGSHFMKGDDAAAEGAIAAGCRFYAGYPITPSSEIAERMSWRLPQVGGRFIQMEDEISSMAAIIGASCAGARPMTATSGPGLSLMLENVGLAYMMETPCVIVDVQRGGPSTGLPTLTSQSDMMQACWGSHGDHRMVAYAPGDVQEMFDHTVAAFNTAERLRTPVLVLADQVVGQMTAGLRVPPDAEIPRDVRPLASGPREKYKPYDSQHLVPPMALAGMGYRVHMTGLTHDEHGRPNTTAAGQARLVPRLARKVEELAPRIVERRQLDDADIALIVYGSTLGPALEAMRAARAQGLRVGILRLVTPWPFPAKEVEAVTAAAKRVIMVEANLGQMVHPVREVSDKPVQFLGSPGGTVFRPEELLRAIKEAPA